jgi:hypothetical protein
MKIRKRVGICIFIVSLLLQGCDLHFTPTPIPTIGIPPTVSQPFQGIEPTPTDTPEMTELKEAVDLLFDPYRGTLPEDLMYEDSVYDELNNALAEAYRNCGYDLSTIAITTNSNPMTEKKFEDCLSESVIIDADSGDEFSTYDWLEKRLIYGGEDPFYALFLRTINVDTTNLLNFEPNYLYAQMETNKDELLKIKSNLIIDLLENNNGDPTEALEFLETYKLSLMGTE